MFIFQLKIILFLEEIILLLNYRIFHRRLSQKKKTVLKNAKYEEVKFSENGIYLDLMVEN